MYLQKIKLPEQKAAIEIERSLQELQRIKRIEAELQSYFDQVKNY
jgi:hypothetical protein